MFELNATSGIYPIILQNLQQHQQQQQHQQTQQQYQQTQQQQQISTTSFQQHFPSSPSSSSSSSSSLSSLDLVNDYDTRPIDLKEFIESASGDHITRAFFDFATSSSTTSAASSAAFSIASSTASVTTHSTTLQPFFTPDNFFNFTLYGIYDNETLPNFQYPFQSEDADNWTHTCEDVYNPNLFNNRVEFWVCGVALNVVGILGIIGNIISMIILSRPQMRSSINYLLIGLARCDTVLIITSMLLFGIPSIYPSTGYFFFYYNYIYPFISPVVYPIAMIAQTASIYMTFTVTLERYVAVCHPLRARALCTHGRAKIYFFISVLFAVLYNIPRFWEVLTVSYKPANSSIILHCVRPSLLRRNQTYINIYILWCYLIINYIIPFLTLAILNCLIYKQVKRANRERQRLSRSERREIGLATMLLCVVVVFFCFNFLALVLNISEAFYDFIDHSLTKLSNLFVTVNSGANFLIYVIFGEKFKRLFLLIFFKRRLSRDQPDLIHYESSISNNGDGTINHRSSGRFSRHGTQRSTTTTYLAMGAANMNNVRITQTGGSPGIVKIKRNRAPSPGPVVYYPARDVQRSTAAMTVLVSNNNTALGCDWVADAKNGQMTSGF